MESGALSSAASAPLSASRRATVLPLLARLGAREAQRVGRDGAERRRRLVVPYGVDGVLLARDQAGAHGRAGRRKPVALARTVEAGVVAERGALGEMLPEPLVRRRLGDVPVLVEGVVHLRRRLQCIAPVDEERRPPGQHDRHAGRAGEAGEPGQAPRPARHILALMLVAERHHEAIQAAPRERGPERRKPSRRLRAVDAVGRPGAGAAQFVQTLGQCGPVPGFGMDQAQPAPIPHSRCGDTAHERLDLVDGPLHPGIGERQRQRLAPPGVQGIIRHGGSSASAPLTASISA